MRSLYFLFLLYSLSAQICLIDAQGSSITFSPAPPCIGEQVTMICYVQAPEGDTFGLTTALISINGSATVATSLLNTLIGADVSRYTADASGLTNNQTLVGMRLVISNYLPSDSDTTFQCAGQFANGTLFRPLLPESPIALAAPVTNVQGTHNVTILPNCSINTGFAISNITSNRVNDLRYSFELRNFSTDSVIESQDNLIVPEVTFSHTFQIDVCYKLSFTARNCAGMDSSQPLYFSLPGIRNSVFGKQFLEISSTNSSRFEWKYTPVSNCSQINFPKYLFSFSVIDPSTNLTVFNVTEDNFDFYLPERFDFYVPKMSGTHALRITFCNQILTDPDITIELNIVQSPIVTILLAVIAVLLLIIFLILITIIIIFVIIHFKRKRDSEN